jgi:hypothetical protein
MASRTRDLVTLNSSGTIVNVKTMSYKPNYNHADLYFEEEDMCPPADPFYIKRANSFLKKHRKRNLIVVSGTLWYVKNQLKMFEDLDPDVVKNYDIVIIGPERDHEYVRKIRNVCDSKRLRYYLIGSVSREMANDIKTLSRISLIPMDMRVFGQPKGYPRTLGESIGSKCLTVCNMPITVPKFYSNTCIRYNESVAGDLNLKISDAILLAERDDFLKNHDWGEKSYEDVCMDTIKKCHDFSQLHTSKREK